MFYATRGAPLRALVSLALLASMVVATPATAPAGGIQPPKTPFNFEVLGHHGGIYHSLDTTGTTLLAVQGSALVAYDGSTGADPIEVGSAPSPAGAGGLFLDGDRAYVVGDHQFAIYDISDPASPEYKGMFELDAAYDIEGFFAVGDYVYLGYYKAAYDARGVKVICVDDPLKPEIVGYGGFALRDEHPVVADSVVYAAHPEGVQVLDLTRATGPKQSRIVPTADPVSACVIDSDGYLVAATAASEADEGDLRTYSLSTPLEPALVDENPGVAGIALGGQGSLVWRLGSDGLETWLPAGGGDLSLVDTETADAGVQVAGLSDGSHTWAFVRTMTEEPVTSSIQAYEYGSTPPSMSLVGSLQGVAGDTAAVLNATEAYVTNGDGLRILDITDPASPAVLGSATATGAADVAVHASTAYVATTGGLAVFDVTAPGTPVLLGTLETEAPLERVAVTTETVCAITSEALLSIDASDPTSPAVLGDWAAPKHVWDLDLDGDRAFVTYGAEGSDWTDAAILDVSDPTDPTLLDTHGLPGGMPAISASDGMAYTALTDPVWGGAGVKVFDVSGDSLNYKKYFGVEKRNAYDVDADGPDLTVAGATSTHRWGVEVPTMPYLRGWSPPGGARVDAEGDLVAVCGPEDGTTFLRHEVVSFRSFGGNRYSTACKMAEELGTSDWVVLATGENFPDALAGVPLAVELGAPILLVQRDSIPSEVVEAIENLGSTKAYVLGGDSVVAPSVASQLTNTLGFSYVRRLAGADRYETARVIAERLREHQGGGDVKKAFVATGENFPDALAASAVAAKTGCPILLVKPNEIPDAVDKTLDEFGTTDTVIVGGTGAVSAGVASHLPSPERLSGTDRYATAVEIAQWAMTDPGAAFDANDLYVVTGTNFPDALSCGVLAARDSAPMVLVGADLPTPSRDFVAGKAAEVSKITIVGGAGAVSSEVERWVYTYAD